MATSGTTTGTGTTPNGGGIPTCASFTSYPGGGEKMCAMYNCNWEGGKCVDGACSGITKCIRDVQGPSAGSTSSCAPDSACGCGKYKAYVACYTPSCISAIPQLSNPTTLTQSLDSYKRMSAQACSPGAYAEFQAAAMAAMTKLCKDHPTDLTGFSAEAVSIMTSLQQKYPDFVAKGHNDNVAKSFEYVAAGGCMSGACPCCAFPKHNQLIPSTRPAVAESTVCECVCVRGGGGGSLSRSLMPKN
jgi:hypothetical protein